MKILIITENTHYGGLDSFLITLINNWPYPEDELILVCNESHPGLKIIFQKVDRDCHIIGHRIPLFWELINKIEKFLKFKYLKTVFSDLFNYSLIPVQIIILTYLFKKHKADYLLSVNGGYPAGGFCRTANIVWGLFHKKKKSVHNFHNMTIKPRLYKRWLEYFLDNLLVLNTEHIVSVSEACMNSMELRPYIIKSGKLKYIHDGIEPPVNTKSSHNLRVFFGLNKETPLCLMLGVYEPRKGHEFLCKVFKYIEEKNPDVHLVICGYGLPGEMEAVKTLVKSYRLEHLIHLLEFQDDINSLFSQVQVLCVASQSFESFGLTSVEAMANKIPVVATNVGGIPEVVKDGEGGFCFSHDDVEGYGNCILKMMDNEQLRVEQGEKGFLRYKENFTGKKMAEAYGKLTRDE